MLAWEAVESSCQERPSSPLPPTTHPVLPVLQSWACHRGTGPRCCRCFSASRVPPGLDAARRSRSPLLQSAASSKKGHCHGRRQAPGPRVPGLSLFPGTCSRLPRGNALPNSARGHSRPFPARDAAALHADCSLWAARLVTPPGLNGCSCRPGGLCCHLGHLCPEGCPKLLYRLAEFSASKP